MPLNGNSPQPRRWPATVLAVLAAVGLLAVFGSHREESVPIRTAQVEQGQIRSLIATHGQIEPVPNFEAHAPVSASVERVLVKEGAEVRKGQLLVVLDDADARTQAARAEPQLEADQAALGATE